MKIGPYKINQVHQGDALECLKRLPDDCIQCVVTSPPYWGMRDYNVEGQIGLEPTPGEHVERVAEIFREVRRVLRNDGTLWLNYGDCYYTAKGSCNNPGGGKRSFQKRLKSNSAIPAGTSAPNRMLKTTDALAMGLKPKDLVGIPWRIAFALQADGWLLRSDIIWHKPNSMPESVGDRPAKAHEHLFLMAKRGRYFYDAYAIRVENAESSLKRYKPGETIPSHKKYGGSDRASPSFLDEQIFQANGRNKRDVWTIPSAPYSGAHFATFPPALVRPCVLAGTSAKGACPNCGAPWERIVENSPMIIKRSDRRNALGKYGRTAPSGKMVKPAETRTTGWKPTCKCVDDFERNFSPHQPLEPTARSIVLDPFAGSGTTGEVAIKLGRDFIGFELNAEYSEKFANPRLQAAKQGLTLIELKSGQRGLFAGDEK